MPRPLAEARFCHAGRCELGRNLFLRRLASRPKEGTGRLPSGADCEKEIARKGAKPGGDRLPWRKDRRRNFAAFPGEIPKYLLSTPLLFLIVARNSDRCTGIQR